MICKKCETAVSETDKKCPNCGAPLRLYANHKFWLAALILLLILIMAAVYFMKTRMLPDPRVSEDIPAQTYNPSEPPASDISPEPSDNPAVSSETAVQPTPVFSGDPGKSESEIKQMVQNTALAAEKYRSAYSGTNEFVSKNGLLYDFPAEMYISAKKFTEEDGFNMAYADEEVMILYVKAGDMPPDITNGLEPGQLSIFAAFPSGNNYIASNGYDTASVSAGAMQGILDRYSADHGPITLIRSDTAAFADVTAAIESSPGLSGPLDIRYMAEDEKYISAVASPRGSPTLIREFILQKTDKGSKIYIDKIEAQWQKFVAINSAAPDVNLDLVPAYNLYGVSKDLKTDFSALLNSMAASGIIPREDGNPVFISGNSEFVFMEFANGMRMLAHNDDGHNDWKVYQVLKYEDAVLRMKELSILNPPPYYLIKQN